MSDKLQFVVTRRASRRKPGDKLKFVGQKLQREGSSMKLGALLVTARSG